MKSSEPNGILIIGAPSWGQNHPFYSIAVVAQVARNCGWKAVPLELNVEFYNMVTWRRLIASPTCAIGCPWRKPVFEGPQPVG